jgi:hypothetical protein
MKILDAEEKRAAVFDRKTRFPWAAAPAICDIFL